VATLFCGNTFLQIAQAASRRSKDDKSEAVVAIVFSAMSIEVFLNELIELASDPIWASDEGEDVKVLISVLDALEHQHAPIDLKIQMAHYILRRQQLDRGSLPYQDFDLLCDIRNALVHKKPEKLDWRPEDTGKEFEPHKFVKRLADRRVISLPPACMPPQWQHSVSCPEVACWSCGVAEKITRFLIDLIPAGKLKEAVEFTRKDGGKDR
jgi:hypothetical protein